MSFTTCLLLIQAILFTVMLCIGITGSSAGLAKNSGIVRMDSHRITGQYRPIRGDEWAVGTALSIAQYYANPQFPQINPNLSVDGQKLAIAHDTGVPVKEISAFGKPALWGFFMFDLRRGLAWYWLFPVFFAVNSFWLLLNLLWQKQEKANFVLALAATFGPYSVVWSFWPVYIASFAAFTVWSFLKLLDTEDKNTGILYSILSGLSGASLVLTLYLPRMIPCAYLMFFVAIGYIWQNKLYKNLRKKKWNIFLAAAVFCVILGSWWYNNADVIALMLNSEYPGRRFVAGGRFGFWDFVRGWLSPVTMYNNLGWANECELTTFFNLLPPLLLAVFLTMKRHDIAASAAGATLFIFFCMVYQYAGIPDFLALITGWSHVTETRADAALEIAQILLIAYLYSQKNSFHLSKSAVTALTAAYIIFVWLCLDKTMPPPIKDFSHTNSGIIFLLTAIAGGLTYLLITDIRKFLTAFTVFTLATTLPYHPLTIAPSKVETGFSYDFSQKENLFEGRIVIASPINANLAVMPGLKIYNVVQHYADRSIYNKFYKHVSGSDRYNHLLIEINDTGENLNVTIPQGDVIKISVNGRTFDFSEFGADYLIVTKDKGWLDENSTLQRLSEDGNFIYYRILHSFEKSDEKK